MMITLSLRLMGTNVVKCYVIVQSKGLDTAAAAVRVSGLELGGLAGSLSAGQSSVPGLIHHRVCCILCSRALRSTNSKLLMQMMGTTCTRLFQGSEHVASASKWFVQSNGSMVFLLCSRIASSSD